ncbi:O-acetyl-ADP-ribose deacetylase [Olavius algarvensis spirochete endosymbiont]|nr:O-acetyl-ADP-ribose deacetylase [Olavius algarvensis spirochete endosymbiont]
MQWLNRRIEALKGDITALEVDAIVNAANSSLLGGGGVDGAIHRAGGPDILAECKKIRDIRYPSGLPVGEAVVSGAGNLPCKWVIHTVGPIWNGGGNREEELLAAAYRNSLEAAAELEAHSIAYPAISTGIYRFPQDRAAKVVWKTLPSLLRSLEFPKKIYLVFFSNSALSTFLNQVSPPEVPQ